MYYAEHSGGKKEQKNLRSCYELNFIFRNLKEKKIQDDQKKLFSVESNTNPENHKLLFQSNTYDELYLVY